MLNKSCDNGSLDNVIEHKKTLRNGGIRAPLKTVPLISMTMRTAKVVRRQEEEDSRWSNDLEIAFPAITLFCCTSHPIKPVHNDSRTLLTRLPSKPRTICRHISISGRGRGNGKSNATALPSLPMGPPTSRRHPYSNCFFFSIFYSKSDLSSKLIASVRMQRKQGVRQQ